MGKLTFQKINHAKPREKQYKLSDGLGLNLLIKPNGSKLWQGKYRFGGKEKTHSMGAFPEVSILDARQAWESTRRELKAGIDPSVTRKKAKLATFTISENTFRAVAEDWFVTKLSDKSQGHRDREYGLLRNHLYPALGRIPLEEINAQVLLDAIRKVEANGTLNAAHRALRVAGAVFRYGIAIGKCSRDPSGDLKGALKPHKTAHRAAIVDPKPFGALVGCHRHLSRFSNRHGRAAPDAPFLYSHKRNAVYDVGNG
ncbi:MAG: integrase arm-type DNA-binding domain-containing protein [Litoreibacter sp.]